MALIAHPTNRISERVIGAAIEVHRQLGPGLLECSYQACLRQELELRGVECRSEVVLPVDYKGIQLSKGYVLDLLVENAVVVEAKSVEKLLPIHSAQLLTYMRLLKAPAGLLINFNVDLLSHGIRRMLL